MLPKIPDELICSSEWDMYDKTMFLLYLEARNNVMNDRPHELECIKRIMRLLLFNDIDCSVDPHILDFEWLAENKGLVRIKVSKLPTNTERQWIYLFTPIMYRIEYIKWDIDNSGWRKDE